MKNLIVFLLIFLAAGIAKSQPAQFMIKKGNKGLYIDHTVVPREGLFSVGRLYNVHPKAIAEYNGIDMGKGLSIGQVLHIPLTDTNFSQGNKTDIPIYYRVGEKENLQKISSTINKVSLQHLRDWNRLTNDNIKTGTNLIVGFLVLDNSIINGVKDAPKEEPRVEKTANVKTEDKPVNKKEEPVSEEKMTGKTGSKPPPPVEQSPKITEEKALPKKEEPAVSKSVVTKPEEESPAQGYFKRAFEQQVMKTPVSKAETVTSGIFKINTGMQDAKYYLLADNAVPGTIVRIINPGNNRAVYAKVLGEMSGIRQNKGLDIRISDTAAYTLGISDTEKFIVKITY